MPRPIFPMRIPLSWLMMSFLFLGCGSTESNVKDQEKGGAPREVRVSVMEVRPSAMRDLLILPGETKAWEDVRVSSDMDGVVEWIGPKEGQEVKRGDLVARIDVAAKKAVLDRTRASFELADELLKRRQSLFQRGIISKEELDKALTERTLAEANFRQAQVEYEKGFVKSPLNGVVNHIYVDPGEYVSRGAPIMDIVNVSKIKIQLNVPEMEVRFLKAGSLAEVSVDALPEKRFTGKVEFVAYKADPATKTFPVEVSLENPQREIRPGMIARVIMVKRIIPDALAVPLFALLNKGGERMVFIERDGTAEGRTVSIGVIEGDIVQIVRGLNPGDRVIVSGQGDVEEGMRVRVE